MSGLAREEILVLFDVDGTLTKPRAEVEPDFEEFMYSKVKPRATIGKKISPKFSNIETS